MFDKMIADMLGITPAEMQEMLTGMQTLLRDGVETLNTLNKKADENAEKLDRILKLLGGGSNVQ